MYQPYGISTLEHIELYANKDKKLFRYRFKHGLWTPNEAIEIPNFWAREDNLGRYIFGKFISLINQYLYKKQSLDIQIPNSYLELGFEFGL